MTEVETVICYGLGYPAFNQRTVSGLRRIAGVFVWSPYCEMGPNEMSQTWLLRQQSYFNVAVILSNYLNACINK